MPWKECQIVDERLRFIARLLDGEKMAGLCREFSIARKTGYKIYTRYKDCGLEGLTDRSRRPYRHANQLPVQIETLIVALKREYPRWGAPKIRARLRRRYPDLACPAISTVHAVLDRHGLVTRRKRRRYKAPWRRPATTSRRSTGCPASPTVTRSPSRINSPCGAAAANDNRGDEGEGAG